MPFSQFTFCGASVIGFTTSMGWNDQISQLTVKVVVDPVNGDVFSPPGMGEPVYFQFFGFRFFGILQKIETSNSSSGFPTYELVCQDPREILAGTQLVLSSYSGATNAVDNLLNVYGYCENIAFGYSQVNSTGMPFNLVKEAILAMVNNPLGTSYGGPLQFMGISYSLDLSELPVPPPFYRVRGGEDGISLSTLIAQVCEDGGCDYFVELVGYNIKIRTVSRFNQPALGSISTMANTNYGNSVVSSRAGKEVRNEITSSFLVGGEQTYLYSAVSPDGITPFWGFDTLGQPILGVGVGDSMAMDLNATEIADILGGFTYPCTVREMRCALANQEMWCSYIAQNRTDIATLVGLASPYKKKVSNPKTKKDMVNTERVNVQALSEATQALVASVVLQRMGRLHAFVRKVAETYMGKQFLVGIPFALRSVEPDTLRIVWSSEPTEAAWQADGAEALGLSVVNQDKFMTQDERFEAFVVYNAVSPIPVDTTRTQTDQMVVQDNGLYMRCEVLKQIYLVPAPCVVIKVASPVYALDTGPLGDMSAMAGAMNATQAQYGLINQRAIGGTINQFYFPAALQPDYAFIPIKSNILTYGPWYVAGPSGKVRFQHNSSLVPWEYGGYTMMNLAAQAIVANAVTYQQVGETGSIQLVGTPDRSLGDSMQNEGSIVTNMQVGYGKDGVVTNYELRTWTPKFGVFDKGNADRIKRLALTNQEMRRNVRSAIKNAIAGNMAMQAAQAGSNFNIWYKEKLKCTQRSSPFEMLGASVYDDEAGGTRLDVSSFTLEEGLPLSNAHDDTLWQATALMSLEGLLRPISTYVSDTVMSHYVAPSGSLSSSAINSTNYNPFLNGSDIEILSDGDTYEDMHAYLEGNDPEDTRALGLRGPVIVSGWGYGINGQPVPGDGAGNYIDGVLRKSHLWPAGPVDLLFDNMRGVWTSHDIMLGTLAAGTSIATGASANATIWNGTTSTSSQLAAYNWFNTTITAPASGTLKVMLGYVAYANKWYIMATDC